jgi:hypothetical protein
VGGERQSHWSVCTYSLPTVERAKIRIRTAESFKMPEICGDTVGDRPRVSLCFLLAETWWEMRPWCLLYYLGISQSVSLSL